jgi:RimJ/RimL family protein N-acetyltransferase
MLCEAGEGKAHATALCEASAVALRLRDTAEPDLPAVLALEADPDVAPWITRWSAARHRRAITDADEAHLIFRDGPRTAGFLLLAGLSGEHRSVELRRIALSRRGEGLGAVALDLALGHAFATFGARRVWLDVLPGNVRAERLYERAGFVDEGILREAHLLPDGSLASLRLMSTLAEDWAARGP